MVKVYLKSFSISDNGFIRNVFYEFNLIKLKSI